MNSYPSMPGGSIAQFYHQAAVSAASAGSAVGVDSLANSQLSSSALTSVGSANTGLPDITRHPWLVTGELQFSYLTKNLSDSYTILL